MNRILLSILTIGVVATLAYVGFSRAFFTDTQTSNGNTFQAGDLKLTIDSAQHYDGLVCGPGPTALTFQWRLEDPNTPSARPDLVGKPCTGTWPSRGLTGEKFFDFADLKPGDWGENTVSLTPTNDAWMCANITRTNDDAKLSPYLSVFWWIDKNGDNKYTTDEKILYPTSDGTFRTLTQWFALTGTNTLPLTFADSVWNWSTGNTPPILPMPMNITQHLGIGWCFGKITLTSSVPQGWTCDGSDNANNAAQDGIFQGNLTFNVEQSRNNPAFLCPEHGGPTPTRGN
jgi:hypothetical protein